MSNIKKLLVLTIVLLLTVVSSCKGKNKLKEVTFNNIPEVLYEGDSLTVDYTKQENVVSNWDSSNKEVATVKDGVISALKEGQFTLKVEFTLGKELKKYEFSIKVEKSEYGITYHLDGGVQNSQNPSTYNINNLPLALSNPTKEGSTFLGWYLSSNFSGNQITEIASGTKGELNLYAKWNENAVSHEISYVLDGGILPENAPTSFVEGVGVDLVEPEKAGYTFLGWYLSSDFSGNAVTEIAADTAESVTLYAKWEKIPVVHEISYVLDGGTLPENAPTSFVEGVGVDLVEPEKEGYTFLGWKLSKTSSTYVTKISASITNKCTLYAIWEKTPINREITYVLNGGSVSADAPLVYTEGIELILPIPTKANYEFAGWTLEENSTSYITKLSKTQTGDVILYAQWQEKTVFTITYIYEEGKLPTQKPTTVEEFLEYFWQEFHKWSGSADTLANFKSACLSKWSAGSAASYKLYDQGADVETKDDEFFFHAKANFDTWMPVLIGFESAVNDINSEQSIWASAWTAHKRFNEFFSGNFASYWTDARKEMVYSTLNIPIPLTTSYKLGDEFDLLNLVIDDGRTFLGWYDDEGNKVEKITADMKGDLVLTAMWSASTPVDNFTVDNEITKLAKFTSHQLKWTLGPSNATNKRVLFKSSDKSVLTVTEEGLLYGVAEGTAEVTITVLGNTDLNVTLTIEVFVDPFIDGSYETVSYVEPENTIQLKATLHKLSGKILWKSNNPSVATVDASGIVTGVKAGYAEIVAYVEGNEDINLSMGVTIIPLSESEFFKLIAESHNEEVYFVKDLNVAFGAYYTDVICSVSDIYYNHPFYADQTLRLSQAVLTETGRKNMSKIEFVTVHYNGMPQKGVTGHRTALSLYNNYRVGNTTCWHYSTGNDGVYQSLDDYVRAAHAGDGFNDVGWTNTGVKANSNTKPVYSVSNGKLVINGTTSNISIPNTSYPLTYFGPAWKVVDGYYYTAKMWSSSDYRYNGMYGGNQNSIGIESACDEGSDLWKTYHITAQLVANLLKTHNLDLTRVYGHHAYSGKDCPQTLLENNGELWVKFMELVEAEYKLLQQMSNYTITMESNNPEILDNNGRITKLPNETTTVSYTVTVKNNSTGVEKTATFASVVHGAYTR